MKHFLLLLSILVWLTLSACTETIDNDKLRVDFITQKDNGFNINILPLTPASAELRNATSQGLVKFDSRGNIVPGLASRWIVTDDGLSYIFRIQKTWWQNGDAVTAEAVSKILNNSINKLRKTSYVDEIDSIEEIIAMTGRIIEIRLTAPRPNLLEILAQPEMGIIYNGFGSGPMQAKKQLNHVRLRHIEFDEEGEIDSDDAWVMLNNINAPYALARYNQGDTDLILGGGFQDLPYFTASGIDEALLSFDPVPGLFGFLFVGNSDYLSSEEVRDAITMAIDRPRLLIDFRNDWREVLTISPETLQNRASVQRPEWTNLRIDQRIQTAKQTILTWKSNNGAIRDIRIAMPVGPGTDIVFARIKADLAKIGIGAVKKSIGQKADLQMIDRVAALSGPSWYLSQLSCKKTVVCDEQADDLVREARATRDANERSNLLAAAERIIQQKRNYIPIAYPIYWVVARPGLSGFSNNPRGLHPLQYLGREPI